MKKRVMPSGQESADDRNGYESNGPQGSSLRPETMGQLTGQLAHDFNNVLAVTLTSVEVAMRVGDPAKATGFLTNAIEVIKRGRTLTDRLAAASQACETPTNVDMHALILKVVGDVAKLPGGIANIVAQLEAEQHEVAIDSGFFATALENLLLNAREAMAGEGDVTVSTRNASGAELHSDRSRNYIVIAVKDTGAGMSDEIRNRAFDLFFTTKTSESWRGTGLSQVRDAMRRAGGSASIESCVGSGTTVTLAIPLS
ncbi:MAG TPA: ATP-binding protein [Rhodanobacteraceae bacterium]|nr:ATP-binding protein [Rhodanobacteraceae bacterium]